MAEKYNTWSFVLCIICVMFSLQSLYAAIYQAWYVAPSLFVLWILTVIAFKLGIIGSDAQGSRSAKWRRRVTITISFSLSVILLLTLAINLLVRESIETSHSPDGGYTIKLYTENGGATSSINVIGRIDGPLWFRKTIYNDMNMHKADVEWINNYTVSINNHVLILEEGETFSD